MYKIQTKYFCAILLSEAAAKLNQYYLLAFFPVVSSTVKANLTVSL
jgi:hypothetical protein